MLLLARDGVDAGFHRVADKSDDGNSRGNNVVPGDAAIASVILRHRVLDVG